MNVSSFQALHANQVGAPRIGSIISDIPISVPRYFVGSGPPTNTTLLAGNSKYNASTSGYIVNVLVSAAGTGYAPGDVLTTTGGTLIGGGAQCQITLSAVTSAGGASEARVTGVGSYSVYPSNPVSVTGGGGTGATFNFARPTADFYLDVATPASPVMYICVTAGDATTSVWATLGGNCPYG